MAWLGGGDRGQLGGEGRVAVLNQISSAPEWVSTLPRASRMGDWQTPLKWRHSAFMRKNVIVNINCEQEEEGVREQGCQRLAQSALMESNSVAPLSGSYFPLICTA